jgi:hypothetical protein
MIRLAYFVYFVRRVVLRNRCGQSLCPGPAQSELTWEVRNRRNMDDCLERVAPKQPQGHLPAFSRHFWITTVSGGFYAIRGGPPTCASG